MGEELFDSEVDEMIREADVQNVDGRISLGEFTDIVVKAGRGSSLVKWQNLYRKFSGELARAKRGR